MNTIPDNKTIRSFRDLIAYQKARIAAKKIFELSKAFPREEKYSLTDQVRRSSKAVGAMIAEAWARRRYKAVWCSKLDEALAECSESQAWLDSAIDAGYISEEIHAQHEALFREIGAIINSLIDKVDLFCPKARK